MTTISRQQTPPREKMEQLDDLCIVYVIIELLAIRTLRLSSVLHSPFSTPGLSHSLLQHPTPLGSCDLANLAGARLLGRLYETVGKGVTPSNSSGTEQDDNDESQSHQDPGDPSECLGGDNLVAVDQTVG